LQSGGKHFAQRGQVNAPESAAAASEMKLIDVANQLLERNMRKTRSIKLKNVMDQITPSR